jgi:hypothetical protein
MRITEKSMTGLMNFPRIHSHEQFFDTLPKHGYTVEVGVLKGRNAGVMEGILMPSKLVLIDTWEDYQDIDDNNFTLRGEDNMALAKNKFQHNPYVEFWRGKSSDMIPKLPDKTVAVGYLDASHWYEDVLLDLELMLPKMMPGGWLCGHDYCEIYQYGVIRAVAVFLDRHKELALDVVTDYPLGGVLSSERVHYQRETACNVFGIRIP